MKVIYHVDVREDISDPEDIAVVKDNKEQVELCVVEVFSKALNIDPSTVSVELEEVREDQ